MKHSPPHLDRVRCKLGDGGLRPPASTGQRGEQRWAPRRLRNADNAQLGQQPRRVGDFRRGVNSRLQRSEARPGQLTEAKKRLAEAIKAPFDRRRQQVPSAPRDTSRPSRWPARGGSCANANRSASPDSPSLACGRTSRNRHSGEISTRATSGEISSSVSLPASTINPPCKKPYKPTAERWPRADGAGELFRLKRFAAFERANARGHGQGQLRSAPQAGVPRVERLCTSIRQRGAVAPISAARQRVRRLAAPLRPSGRLRSDVSDSRDLQADAGLVDHHAHAAKLPHARRSEREHPKVESAPRRYRYHAARHLDLSVRGPRTSPR